MRESQNEFKASLRAYVTFGAKDGKLVEFGKLIGDKPALKVYVFNAGQTAARHLSVQVRTSNESGPFTHRHRAVDSLGRKFTRGPGNEVDLAGQGEHVEWITDPKALWTSKELDATAGMGQFFFIHGEIQYCDIFGAYHCEQFGARYLPSVHEFTAWIGSQLPCVVEKMDRSMLQTNPPERNIHYKETSQCEQPGEPEYYGPNAPVTTLFVGP